MVEDVKPGGTFLLELPVGRRGAGAATCPRPDEALHCQQRHAKFYTIDGIKIGKEIGLGGRINTVLQSAFFKLANIIPAEDAIKYMKDAATASYSKKGEAIVKMNHDAIEAGAKGVHEVQIPESWKTAPDTDNTAKATGSRKDLVDFVNDIVIPVNDQKGDTSAGFHLHGRPHRRHLPPGHRCLRETRHCG